MQNTTVQSQQRSIGIKAQI